MTIELTPEEKKSIVEQHLKNTAYAEYNVDLNLIEANASSDKDQPTIESLMKQKTSISSQKTALQSELDLINAEIAKTQNS